ncbi:MAG: glycoside hydrolase family 2 [Rhodanobacter sp.]
MKARFCCAIILALVAGLTVPSVRAQDAGVNAQAGASAPSAAGETIGPDPAMRIRIGRASRLLTGPWRFQPGDDMRRAAPGFDDSRWETADLTPAPGAHDSDVGYTDYVPGWRARGHADYSGYAWYRMHVAVDVPAGTGIALLAPAYVEDAYQVFWNGVLIGGVGDFSGRTPVIYSTRPQVFRLPSMAAGGHDAVIAIRVWMRPGVSREPDGGGIHTPPTLGTNEAVHAQYRLQWLQTFNGYVVEVAEPFAFVLLAMLAWCFRTVIARGRFVHWLCAALLLNAAFRLNQAVYSWMPYESFPVYFALYRILPPLGMAAWIMAWRHWHRLEHWRWLTYAIGGATLLGVVLVLALNDDAFAMASPAWRVPMALVLLATAVAGLRRRQPDRMLAFVAVLLVAVSQFSTEVSALGVPGIWFPFGVGVSRTQYAYAALVVVLAGLLIRQVRRAAGKHDAGEGAAAPGAGLPGS